MWEEIKWALIYTVLGIAVIFFVFRVRRLRAELKALQEEARERENGDERTEQERETASDPE